MAKNAKILTHRRQRTVLLALCLVLGAELLLVSLAHAWMAPPANGTVSDPGLWRLR